MDKWHEKELQGHEKGSEADIRLVQHSKKSIELEHVKPGWYSCVLVLKNPRPSTGSSTEIPRRRKYIWIDN